MCSLGRLSWQQTGFGVLSPCYALFSRLSLWKTSLPVNLAESNPSFQERKTWCTALGRLWWDAGCSRALFCLGLETAVSVTPAPTSLESLFLRQKNKLLSVRCHSSPALGRGTQVLHQNLTSGVKVFLMWGSCFHARWKQPALWRGIDAVLHPYPELNFSCKAFRISFQPNVQIWNQYLFPKYWQNFYPWYV